MKLSVSPDLRHVAEENDYVVVLDRPGYLLVLKPYGYEDSFFIEDREGRFAVLLRGERNMTLTLQMEASRLIDAEKYLAGQLLFGWRIYKLKLPPFTALDQVKDPKPGSRVEEYPQSSKASVIWARVTPKASFRLGFDAKAFTHYQDASFAQMRAAYADPDGAPLFPPPDTLEP
ncbi:hypothetical protein ABH924_004421 [Arthrobacter sp. GAS37]|uniref:hypothetical protein n=1 Tax=Arthrobacter sp. GAS37 TaxID=3156261 RepID=UPI00383493EC